MDFKRPLDRQVREAVEIMGLDKENMLNSKLDHYKPAMRNVTFTNILEAIEDQLSSQKCKLEIFIETERGLHYG